MPIEQKTENRPGNAALAETDMSRDSGRPVADKLAAIRQSLHDIFTTPIGSRIQRREYGSYLFALIDAPMNPANRLRLAAALVDAATRWEPRVTLESAIIEVSMDGKTVLNYRARLLDDAELQAQSVLN
nr:MAG TPA: baseplate wedge subunit [Caudoviricetes sp.]